MTRPKPLSELSPAYRHRIEVGMGRGLTRQEARGHAGPRGESHYPKRPSPGKVTPPGPTPPGGAGGGGARESRFEREVLGILQDADVDIEEMAEVLIFVREARGYLKEAAKTGSTEGILANNHMSLLQVLHDLLGNYFYPLMRLLYTGKQ